MNQPVVVGIDIAKKDFAVAYRIGEAEVELGKYATEATGFKQLKNALEKVCQKQQMTQIQLVLEATGGYEAALMVYAYEQGWGVSIPNPKKVRDWAKGVGYRVKTDRVDARILAHYGVERRPRCGHNWRRKYRNWIVCSSAAKTWSRRCRRNRHVSLRWQAVLGWHHKSSRVWTR